MASETTKEILLREHETEVLEEIGIGGQAICYRGRCRTGLCALKIHLAPVASADDLPRKLQREIDAQRDLSGPEFADYVLTMQDYYLIGDKLVTRWPLGSGTLADELEKHPDGVEEKKVISWFSHLAKGLDAIHQHTVSWVHADVKPSNIILIGSLPRFCDFGVSRRAENRTSSLSTTRLGTEHYIPKCESADDVKPTRISDFYGFVLCFVQLLQGKHPFGQSKEDFYINRHNGNFNLSGLDERQQEIVSKVLLDETVPESISDWFEDLTKPSVGNVDTPSLSSDGEFYSNRHQQDSSAGTNASDLPFDDDTLHPSVDPTPTETTESSGKGTAAKFPSNLDYRKLGVACVVALLGIAGWTHFFSEPDRDEKEKSSAKVVSNESDSSGDSEKQTETVVVPPSALLMQQVTDAKQKSMTLRDQASRLGANEFDKANVAEAERFHGAAVASLETAKYQAALKSFEEASESYQTAIRHTAKLQRERFADELSTLRAKAVEAKAPNLDAAQFGKAVTFMEETQETKDPSLVFASYEKAKKSFAASIQVANRESSIRDAKEVLDKDLSNLDLELAAFFGGSEWQHRIAQTNEDNQRTMSASRREETYRSLTGMLPSVSEKVRAYEELIASENHKGILELLSGDRSQLPAKLKKQWLISATAAPSWWSDRAEEGATKVAPRLKPIVSYLKGNTLPQGSPEAQKQFEAALQQASGINDGLESASASLVLAQEFATRGRANLANKAIKNMKLAFMGIHLGEGRGDQAIAFQKYMMSLNAAAILWEAGAKQDADETTQVANAKFLSEFSYMGLRGVNMSSFQAIMVFSDASDSNNVSRLSFIQDGKIIIDRYGYKPGPKDYKSLLSPVIYDARLYPNMSMKFRSGKESKRVYAVLGHAQLALLAARMGDRPTYQMHTRRATTMVTNDNANVMVTARSAMAAAYLQEFDLALTQIKQFRSTPAGKRHLKLQTESPESVAFYLGEARLTLGRLQLLHPEADGGGLDGAEQTLASCRNEAGLFEVLLASEIGAAAVRIKGLEHAVNWMEAMRSEELKTAALAGIAKGVATK